MGNLPSSTSTEPLAQSGKHRNLSTISLPPTIPRRHNLKDAERKEIFPISDEGAPPLPGRRGSIGFFRGRRTMAAPLSINHKDLFQNLPCLQALQSGDVSPYSPCSWEGYHPYLSPAGSAPDSHLSSLSSTPTTPIGCYHPLAYPRSPSHPPPPPPSSCQPTSPVAISIQDYHSRQEQKLASFMRRSLLPPHALSTSGSTLAAPDKTCSNTTTASSSPTIDCCLGTAARLSCEQSRLMMEAPASAGTDHIPSTHDVPWLGASEWGNQRRWAGEMEWTGDIPQGLEHDGPLWGTMDSYTIEQHLTRALFKGQNYSAPLDFSRPSRSINAPESAADPDLCPASRPACAEPSLENTESSTAAAFAAAIAAKDAAAAALSSSYSSITTLGPQTPIPSKDSERSLVILSVGCGNSQWATEMALAHPQSAVHAINVSQLASLPPIPESTPSFELENLFFYNLDDNSLRIPFVSNSVDYIHVRRFLPNVSKAKYFAFLRELVRVLKQDGYLELVELDLRLRDCGINSCWPSYWTLIGFDKIGIDTSLSMNLGGILRTMPGMDVMHRSSVNLPVGMHGGRIGLVAELLCWRLSLAVRPWLMRQAMLSGSEFDGLLERAREETRVFKSYQVVHVAVARKSALSPPQTFA